MKRIIATILMAVGLAAAGSALAPAQADIACVGIRSQDLGICVTNPLPPQPPVAIP